MVVGKPEGTRQLDRPSCRWEGNVKMYIKKQNILVWTAFIWLRVETIADCCEFENGPFDSIKDGLCLDQVS